jgi:hypothetical protein
MNPKTSPIYTSLVEIIMAAAWLGLPFTSFPILGWYTNSQAAPLSAIPIGIVLLIWLLPKILQGQKLPMEIVPLLGFVLFAIVSSAAMLFTDIVPFEGRTFAGQSSRALFTLGIGVSFYLVVAAWLRSEPAINRALQFINIGGAIMLIWGLVQIIIIAKSNGYFPAFLDRMRTWLVIQPYGVQIGNRLSGLAYEPSWFAHQLNILYLPIWIAATYLRQSAFRLRILRLSIENILLVFGLIEFILSRPRVGFAALLLMLGYLFIRIMIATSKQISQYLVGHKNTPNQNQKTKTRVLSIFINLGFLILFLGIITGIAYVGSRVDERLELLFKAIPADELLIIKAMDENALMYIGARLSFLERTIYWILGWHIFNDYPLLGVGLGNTGFFAFTHIPATGWMTSEIRDLAYRLFYMINTKSYWLRILAETGIIGFSFFITWLIGLWRSATYLVKNHQKTFLLVGMAAQLSLLAFVFEGFSLDSFALPYLWVSAGMLSAVRMVATQKKSQGNS